MTKVTDCNCVHFLLNALQKRGYTCIGPTVRDAAIIYDEIRSEQDLPIGYTDEQDGGTYRLTKRNDQARFGYAVGPHSWKQHLSIRCGHRRSSEYGRANSTPLPFRTGRSSRANTSIQPIKDGAMPPSLL